jgi:hypothetical protein
MEAIDLFFFWGLFGGLLYLFTYLKTYITFRLNYEFWLFFLSITAIIFLAGNFFVYSMIIVFLLILRQKVLQNQEEASS